MQAVLQAYNSGASIALIMEDDMEILRWPSGRLLFTAPPGWEVLLLYMMGPDADVIYRCLTESQFVIAQQRSTNCLCVRCTLCAARTSELSTHGQSA